MLGVIFISSVIQSQNLKEFLNVEIKMLVALNDYNNMYSVLLKWFYSLCCIYSSILCTNIFISIFSVVYHHFMFRVVLSLIFHCFVKLCDKLFSVFCIPFRYLLQLRYKLLFLLYCLLE